MVNGEWQGIGNGRGRHGEREIRGESRDAEGGMVRKR